MKRIIVLIILYQVISSVVFAQKTPEKNKSIHPARLVVPVVVKTALLQRYPKAANITWEKEKGNFEANWGGNSGEDSSVQFSPAGVFIEIVRSIDIKKLPPAVISYIKIHYNRAKISEAGEVTNAEGKKTYEVEVRKEDLIFDQNGKFIKAES